MKTTILFVCSGNYCRSPLAEGLARFLLARRGLADQFDIISAGTLDVYHGQPPAAGILAVLHELGADGPQRPPHQITADEVARADLILGVAREHVDWLKQHYPEAADRTGLLSGLIGEDWDLADPGRQDLAALRATRNIIYNVLRHGLDQLILRSEVRR